MNETEVEVTNSLIGIVTEKANELISFGGTLLDTVIQHPVLGFFFAAGFISVGISVVGKLIALAKRGNR